MQNVEDILPLAPMQELMLLHLAASHGSEALLEQNVLDLRGNVQPAHLHEAWRFVVGRHPALRSAFLWQGLSKPVQVIRQTVELPWQELDWSGVPESDLQDQLEALSAADRKNRFDPGRAPLLRVALVKIADGRWWLLLSNHHLLLDRWSLGILIKEVFTLHAQISRGETPALAPVRPYRDYLQYVRSRNPAAIEEHWKKVFAGMSSTPPQPFARLSAAENAAPADFAAAKCAVSAESFARLRRLAQSRQTSVSCLVQAAVGLALASVFGPGDWIVGLTLTARPPEIPGIDEMVGLFNNNLPLRLTIPARTTLSALLAEVQVQQAGLTTFASTPLSAVREAAAIAGDHPFFQILLVFQNDPAAEALAAADALGLRVSAVGGHSKTNYPLAIFAQPGESLIFSFGYHRRACDPEQIRRLVEALHAAVETLDKEEWTFAPAATAAPGFAKPAAAPSAAAQFLARASMESSDPGTATEKAIASVWRDLLRIDHITLQDNFFDIGGTSLLAIQATRRLKKEFDFRINTMEVAAQSLAQLAAMCDSRQSEKQK